MAGGDGGIFRGLRFKLAGFHTAMDNEYREEIKQKGGTIEKLYSWQGLYFIVSSERFSFNDPICVEACTKGAVLINELWLEDSLHDGALADTNRILYRPPGSLSGIKGAQNLGISHAGFSCQDSRYIEKLVELMGAENVDISKSSYLICNRFEGWSYYLLVLALGMVRLRFGFLVRVCLWFVFGWAGTDRKTKWTGAVRVKEMCGLERGGLASDRMDRAHGFNPHHPPARGMPQNPLSPTPFEGFLCRSRRTLPPSSIAAIAINLYWHGCLSPPPTCRSTPLGTSLPHEAVLHGCTGSLHHRRGRADLLCTVSSP